MSFCDNPYPCTWNPDKPFSWQVNRKQNATQVFYFVNNWHDHLAAGADRLHRGGGQLPGQEPQPQGRGQRRGRHPDRRRRQHRPRPARRRTTSTTPTWPRRRTAGAADADVPAAPARHVVPGRRPVRADQRRRRGRHRLPRVHPRPVQPARRRRQRPLHARRRAGRRDGRGLERLVRHGLPGRPGACRRTSPARSTWCCSSTTAPGVVARPHRADRLPGRLARRTVAPAASPATPAATPTRDYAAVGGGPEVHSDGEIWAQTLWDLRGRLGSTDHRVAGDPGDGARTAQPVVPRHAQRDPGRRHGGLRRPRTTTRSGRSSPHRGMGFFAGSLRRRRHRAGCQTSPGRRAGHATGRIDGHRHRPRHRQADRGRHRHPGLPGRGGAGQPVTVTGAEGTLLARPGAASARYPKLERRRRRAT